MQQLYSAREHPILFERLAAARSWSSSQNAEREIFIDNLLVRVHLIIEMSRPALRHGSLDSLLQVALYIPSKCSAFHVDTCEDLSRHLVPANPQP